MDYTEIIAATPPSQLYLTPPAATPAGWQPLPLGSMPALPSYYKALNNAAMSAGLANVTALVGATPTDAENSSCLLMAISESRNGIAFNSDNVGTGAVGDTDNNGLQEIVDGWKRPLRFWRWPTGNNEIDALNPAQPGNKSYSFRDPQDPGGLLLGPGFWNNTHTAAMNGVYPFETLFHPIFTLSAYPPSDPRNVPSSVNYDPAAGTISRDQRSFWQPHKPGPVQPVLRRSPFLLFDAGHRLGRSQQGFRSSSTWRRNSEPDAVRRHGR